MKILAIVLGKFNSVDCSFDTTTNQSEFETYRPLSSPVQDPDQHPLNHASIAPHPAIPNSERVYAISADQGSSKKLDLNEISRVPASKIFEFGIAAPHHCNTRKAELKAQGLICTTENLYSVNGDRVFILVATPPHAAELRGEFPESDRPSPSEPFRQKRILPTRNSVVTARPRTIPQFETR